MNRDLGVAVALMGFSAAMWFAWLGWANANHGIEGYKPGPYATWQVSGCAVSIGLATVIAFLCMRQKWLGVALAPLAAVAFAVPLTWDASEDRTGLYLILTFEVVVGGTIGLATLLAIAAAVQLAWRDRAGR